MRDPDKTWNIPLWELNHSKSKLEDEEALDYAAYQLGYEMREQSDDPSRRAYKHFIDIPEPEGNITETDYDPDRPVWLMCDFNRHTQGWALGQVHKHPNGQKVYVVFDEIFTKDALTTEQSMIACEKLDQWNIKKVLLVGDNTSNQRSGNYGRTGRNDFDYLREVLDERGIAWKNELDIQNPKRKVRVDKVNNCIYNGAKGHRRFLVHPRCEKVIRDYKYSVVDDTDGLKIDDGEIGHISDACDYWVYRNERGSMSPMYVIR